MKGFENRTNTTHPQAPGALQEITALLEQITPGPWAWEWTAEKSNEWAVGQAFKEDGTPIEGQIGDGEWLEDTIIERRLIGMNESGHARAADAKFIAAAPRLVRELLAVLASVDARRQELEQDKMKDTNQCLLGSTVPSNSEQGAPVAAPRFTLGPWKIGHTEGIGQRGLLFVRDTQGRVVADCESEREPTNHLAFVRPLHEDMANARLIAAAPELREALREVVAIVDAAGLLNLSNGVQLGATSWFCKASDSFDYARRVLARIDEAPGSTDQLVPNDQRKEKDLALALTVETERRHALEAALREGRRELAAAIERLTEDGAGTFDHEVALENMDAALTSSSPAGTKE